MELPEGTRFMVLAPVVRGRKGEYGKVLEELRAEGFPRAKVDGELRMLEEEIVLDKKFKHDISVVVDRLVMRGERAQAPGRLDRDGGRAGRRDGRGRDRPAEGEGDAARSTLFSEKFACLDHGPSIPELEPRIFSFNSPHGACERCTGLGSQMEIDPELVVPDPSLSIGEGAIAPWADSASKYYEQITEAIAEKYGVDLETPWERAARGGAGPLPVRHQRRARRGLLPQPLRAAALVLDALRGDHPQPRAPLPRDGLRAVAREDRGVHVARAVPGVQGRAPAARVARGARRRHRRSTSSRPVGAPRAAWLDEVELTETERHIARLIFREIEERLRFLDNVGIGYLSMDRAAATLSGGEAQRIRLATQIGSALVGVLYVLDEPSIGLHQRDNTKLIGTLERLRDLGNTVLVVEHDEQTMRAADHLVDLGPGAGEHGGRVVAQGTAEEVEAVPSR